MAKWLITSLVVYAAAVLNNVVAPLVEVGGISPDFLALTAACASLAVSGPCGLFAAGLAGILADINAPGRLGPGMAAFVLMSAALSSTLRLTQRRPLAQSLATWLAVTGMLLGVAMARSVLGESNWSPASFVMGSAASGIYTSLIGLPCYWILDRIDRLRAVAY